MQINNDYDNTLDPLSSILEEKNDPKKSTAPDDKSSTAPDDTKTKKTVPILLEPFSSIPKYQSIFQTLNDPYVKRLMELISYKLGNPYTLSNKQQFYHYVERMWVILRITFDNLMNDLDRCSSYSFGRFMSNWYGTLIGFALLTATPPGYFTAVVISFIVTWSLDQTKTDQTPFLYFYYHLSRRSLMYFDIFKCFYFYMTCIFNTTFSFMWVWVLFPWVFYYQFCMLTNVEINKEKNQ